MIRSRFMLITLMVSGAFTVNSMTYVQSDFSATQTRTLEAISTDCKLETAREAIGQVTEHTPSEELVAKLTESLEKIMESFRIFEQKKLDPSIDAIVLEELHMQMLSDKLEMSNVFEKVKLRYFSLPISPQKTELDKKLKNFGII